MSAQADRKLKQRRAAVASNLQDAATDLEAAIRALYDCAAEADDLQEHFQGIPRAAHTDDAPPDSAALYVNGAQGLSKMRDQIMVMAHGFDR